MLKSKTHTILFLFVLFLSFSKTSALFSEIIQSCRSFAQMIPYKTCAAGIALLYGIREFPHLHTPLFDDNKCYSQYGTNTDFYVLHLHGWRAAHAESFTKQKADEIYIVSPRFSETIDKKLFSTCFGQENDILVTLRTLYETHHISEKIHTVAHCRGAAVFINTVAILCTPESRLLSLVGISEQERLVILKKIKNGNTILISPFLSVNHFIKDWFSSALSPLIHSYILPWLTRYQYNPNGMHVLQSLQSWNTSLPLQVIFPEFDDSIGTSLRKEFIDALYKKNGHVHTKVLILQGETKHWPLFLKTMSYKELFLKFGLAPK